LAEVAIKQATPASNNVLFIFLTPFINKF